MNISFENQQILITGGTRGIGKAIALEFIRSHASLVVITGTKDLTQSELQSLFPNQDLKNLRYAKLNFSTPNFKGEIDKILDEFGHFDVLINNAGINIIEDITELSEESLKKVLDVNLVAPAVLTKSISKGMIENSYGRIINISSIFGQVTRAGRMNYSSSKFGLIGQTKAIALDLAPHNILVNSIAPGFIATELTTRVLGEEGIKEVTSKVPMNRLGQPEEIASGVIYLASRNNTFITAQTLTIDGGFLAT